MARVKQREEELYDKKAKEASDHADKLNNEKKKCLANLRGLMTIPIHIQLFESC